MKHLAVAAASLALSLAPPREAEACTPVPTCSSMFCANPGAVIEATVVDLGQPDATGETTRPTLRVVSAHGDAAEAVVGAELAIASPSYLLAASDVGATYVFYAVRTPDSELRLDSRYAAESFAGCFPADASTETIAATVLAPTCHDELDMPVERTFPVAACVEYTPFGCSAGGAGTGAGGFLAVGLVLFGVAGRKRRVNASRSS